MQVLVLTHEQASLRELEPYAAAALAPLRPLLLYGRTGLAAPSCDRKHSVWHGWMDRGVTFTKI